MKIMNASGDTRQTWEGLEVSDGQPIDTEELGLAANEVTWLLRHGFKRVVAKPKPAPQPEAADDFPAPAAKPKPRRSKIHRRG